jgi:mono/diheme cytochrome c family protein
MKKNKVLLLISSLGVLALLVAAAARENFFNEWRSVQLRAKAHAPETDVRLRQIVIPQLRVIDRCVTCHVGMAPGETALAGDRVLGAHPRTPHDPALLGCTTCHGGQGRATDKEGAHGTAEFWPQPMLPLQYSEAGCGGCHTHLAVPNLDALRRGSHLVEQNDCLACHRLDGRGGTQRPGGSGGMEGPDLSLAGARGFRADWYATHLAKRDAGEKTWATTVGAINDADRAAIDVVLNSRVGAPRLVEAKALFHSRGCRGCHKINGFGGDDGPDLTRAGQRDPGQTNFSRVAEGRSLAGWFKEHFRNPGGVVPGSQMPALGLTEEEIELLTLYTFSLRSSDAPEAFWPKDRIRATHFGESEFSRDPETLYGTLCAACHGAHGEGMRYAGMAAFPAIGSQGFLELATDDFIAATIAKGRPGRRMPAWEHANGLTPAETRSLVGYLRQLGGNVQPLDLGDPKARVAGSPQRGSLVYAQFCAGCHGKKGEGIEGPALANPQFLAAASDRYILETTRRGRPGTSMESFSAGSTIRPALSDREIADVVTHIRSWEVKR